MACGCKKDPKEVANEIAQDVIAKGKLENETGRMDVSIKPDDITGCYPEQEVAKADEGAEHERIVEHVVAGVDENGKPYAYETEEVEGEK